MARTMVGRASERITGPTTMRPSSSTPMATASRLIAARRLRRRIGSSDLRDGRGPASESPNHGGGEVAPDARGDLPRHRKFPFRERRGEPIGELHQAAAVAEKRETLLDDAVAGAPRHRQERQARYDR